MMSYRCTALGRQERCKQYRKIHGNDKETNKDRFRYKKLQSTNVQ